MGVLGVDLLVLFCYENLEITICLPFVFMKLDFCNLFAEDCFTDYCSEKTITDILIFFIEIHKSSKEDREVDDIKEECL